MPFVPGSREPSASARSREQDEKSEEGDEDDVGGEDQLQGVYLWGRPCNSDRLHGGGGVGE